MRIFYISDIHLEESLHIPPIDNHQNAEILILAGDIGLPHSRIYKKFISRMSKIFQYVIVVTGNHEYYGNTVEKIDATLDNWQSDNVYFLQQSSIAINGIRFMGCTLWAEGESDIKIGDFKGIKGMNYKKYSELHSEHVTWLESELKRYEKQPKVVITHHLPSSSLIDPKFKDFPKKKFYYSNLDYLVEQANVWICGHSHKMMQKRIGGCYCGINPIGYPNEDTGYSLDLFLELKVVT